MVSALLDPILPIVLLRNFVFYILQKSMGSDWEKRADSSMSNCAFAFCPFHFICNAFALSGIDRMAELATYDADLARNEVIHWVLSDCR